MVCVWYVLKIRRKKNVEIYVVCLHMQMSALSYQKYDQYICTNIMQVQDSACQNKN